MHFRHQEFNARAVIGLLAASCARRLAFGIVTVGRHARYVIIALALLAPAVLSDDSALALGNSITRPDTSSLYGLGPSLALDTSGRPVVSYESNTGLKVLHCNDANCVGGNESIASPDSASNVGSGSSLELDAAGNPVVSYYDATNYDLKVLHCNDANCAGGGESITSPDTAGYVGSYSSLALDAAGRPVVSYYDGTNYNMKVLHCNDVNCAGGGESITSPDPAGDAGIFTSLALDAADNPVLSYFASYLKVMHCNDANCAGGDESISVPDNIAVYGVSTSLALDASGYPVLSSAGGSGPGGLVSGLVVIHCNDANCAGGGESITPPAGLFDSGYSSSLALEASGFPVISYNDEASLKVLRCNDVNCDGGGESIATADPVVAAGPSLALDSLGRAVVSYSGLFSGLRVLHCSNPACSVGKDADADALLDSTEAFLRLCPSSTFSDSDFDGLKDGVEAYIGSNICVNDTDRDGITDGQETSYARANGVACPHLLDHDSDGDGWPDGQEADVFDVSFCDHLAHPNSAASDAPEGAAAGTGLATQGSPKDTDGDLLPDSFEAALRQCPGSSDADSDNDFLKDGLEAYIGSNICASDTDRDGLSDGAEIYISALRRTPCPHLLDRDSDGDGWTDGREQIRGTSYCNRLSHP